MSNPAPEPHEGRLHRLAHRLAEEDPSDALPLSARLAMTIGPLVGFGIILLIGYLLAGYKASAVLATAEFFSFAGLGKFVILWGLADKLSIGVWYFAGLVVYGDIATSLIMMANITVLYRMPLLGRRLAACHEAGWSVLHVHPWMRRAAWFGVAVFVAAPFQGTGAVIGTLIARILGVSRFGTLSATFVGSAAGCSALALLGLAGGRQVRAFANNPYIAAAIMAVTLVAMVILGRWFTGQSFRQGGGTSEPSGQTQ